MELAADDDGGRDQGDIHGAEEEQPAPRDRPVRQEPVVDKAVERYQRHDQEQVRLVGGDTRAPVDRPIRPRRYEQEEPAHPDGDLRGVGHNVRVGPDGTHEHGLCMATTPVLSMAGPRTRCPSLGCDDTGAEHAAPKPHWTDPLSLDHAGHCLPHVKRTGLERRCRGHNAPNRVVTFVPRWSFQTPARKYALRLWQRPPRNSTYDYRLHAIVIAYTLPNVRLKCTRVAYRNAR